MRKPKFFRRSVCAWGLAAGLLLTGVGCGDSDTDNLLVGGSQGGGSATVLPDLTGQVASDGVQEYVEGNFQASTGGTLKLPNGAILEIPPGALATDQTIRFAYNPKDVALGGPRKLDDYGEDANKDGDMYYDVTPSQALLKPAKLRLPYPLDENWEYPDVVVSSPENVEVPSGSEETRYAPLSPDYDEDKDVIVFTTDHFSGFDLLTAGEPAYLVMDVPQPYLQPSDILMTLTLQSGFAGFGLGKGPGWVPGHVGIYTGPGTRFPNGTVLDTGGSSPQTLAGIPDSIEAVPDKIHAVNVDYFRSGFHSDHLYLGPRRPRGERTQQQMDLIVSEAPRALGKPYYLLGDGGSFLGSIFNPADLVNRLTDPFATDRGYSCVGLVDVLYLRAGRSLVGNFDRAVLAATPKDMMQTTDPVRRVTLRRGQPFSMDFYGVLRVPEFSAVLSRVPYTRDRRRDNDGVVNSYDIRTEGLPSEARFESSGGNGYKLSWTPTSTGIYSVRVSLAAEVYEKQIPIEIYNPFGKNIVIRDNKRHERTKDNPLVENIQFEVVDR